MTRRKHSARIVLATILMSIGSLLAVPQVAHANPPTVEWVKPIKNMYMDGWGEIFSHGDGSLTASECNARPSGSYGIQTFNPHGESTTFVAGNTNYYACYNIATAGADGTIFGLKFGSPDVVAFKNNVQLWSKPPQSSCPNDRGSDNNFTIGADGNLYTLHETNCNTNVDRIHLLGINAQTGADTFRAPLTTYASAQPDRLFAYSDGLVVKDGDTVRYFNYQGVEDTSKAFNLTPGVGKTFRSLAVDYTGKTYVAYTLNATNNPADTTCHRNYGSTQLDSKPAGGTLISESFPNDCFVAYRLNAAPSGAVIDGKNYLNNQRLVVFAGDSSSTSMVYSVDMTGFGLTYGLYSLDVDGNGNAVVGIDAKKTANNERHVRLMVYTRAGGLVNTFSTESLNATPPPGWTYNYFGIVNYTGPALTEGGAYLALCDGDCLNYPTHPADLYKVNLPGVGIDYPRSAIFGAIEATQGVQRKYVALGDSFSSGEGVPTSSGFITPTETNGCHRSSKAYAMVLDQDPAQHLNLQAFRACSGATALNVKDGMNNGNGESSQLDSLGSDTDVVTVTASGNDAGFKPYLVACLDPTGLGCDSSTAAYTTIMDNITNVVPGNLATLFQEMQARLSGNTNVKVLVVGYPFIFREHIPSGCLSISPSEESAAEQVTTALNDAIATAVVSLGDSRFHFVDATSPSSPFDGHDLCGTSSYFNGVNAPPNDEYTAHPNEAGQAAYASLVGNYLAAIS